MRWETNSNGSLLHSIMTQQVLIHCKDNDQSFQDLVNLDLFFEPNCGELDVIVDDVEFDSLTEDPDVLLCNHYGINYDQVNCIELYES